MLFESGLSRRRAREILLQGAQSQALSLFWQAGPAFLAQQLELSPDETARLHAAHANWQQFEQRFQQERSLGLRTLRLNQPTFPDTLLRFLPAEQRPLLLFARGDLALLELPRILPLAAPPDARTEAWALETLATLATDGALPLFVARAGLDARGIQAFLQAELPFALVIPQGLGAYQPPAGLQAAINAGRALLLSPFQPTWQPPARQENPMLVHADAFARALAHAWLALGAPAAPPAAGQVCLCAPEAAPLPHCPRPYENPEALFLALTEAASAPPTNHATSKPAPPPDLPPLSPEEILQTLAQGGKIPAALAARLQPKP